MVHFFCISQGMSPTGRRVRSVFFPDMSPGSRMVSATELALHGHLAMECLRRAEASDTAFTNRALAFASYQSTALLGLFSWLGKSSVRPSEQSWGKGSCPVPGKGTLQQQVRLTQPPRQAPPCVLSLSTQGDLRTGFLYLRATNEKPPSHPVGFF